MSPDETDDETGTTASPSGTGSDEEPPLESDDAVHGVLGLDLEEAVLFDGDRAPYGVQLDPDGGMYFAMRVTDSGTQAALLSLDEQGSERWRFALPAKYKTGGLAVAQAGEVFLVGNDLRATSDVEMGSSILFRLSEAGDVLWSDRFDIDHEQRCVLGVSSNGSAYCVSGWYGPMREYSLSGELVHESPDGGMVWPGNVSDVVVTTRGIYLTGSDGAAPPRLGRMDRSLVTLWSQSLPASWSSRRLVAVGERETAHVVYPSDPAGEKHGLFLQVYDADGNVLREAFDAFGGGWVAPVQSYMAPGGLLYVVGHIYDEQLNEANELEERPDVFVALYDVEFRRIDLEVWGEWRYNEHAVGVAVDENYGAVVAVAVDERMPGEWSYYLKFSAVTAPPA